MTSSNTFLVSGTFLWLASFCSLFFSNLTLMFFTEGLVSGVTDLEESQIFNHYHIIILFLLLDTHILMFRRNDIEEKKGFLMSPLVNSKSVLRLS